MTFNTLYRDPAYARQVLADPNRQAEIDNPTKLSIALSRMLKQRPTPDKIGGRDTPGYTLGKVQKTTTPDQTS